MKQSKHFVTKMETQLWTKPDRLRQTHFQLSSCSWRVTGHRRSVRENFKEN